jgi:hypothetical protein
MPYPFLNDINDSLKLIYTVSITILRLLRPVLYLFHNLDEMCMFNTYSSMSYAPKLTVIIVGNLNRNYTCVQYNSIPLSLSCYVIRLR